MSKKTLDIEKIREAIKTLEEAREVLDKVEKVLPKEQPVPRPYCPRSWHPQPAPLRDIKPMWVLWRDNYTIPPDNTITYTCN